MPVSPGDEFSMPAAMYNRLERLVGPPSMGFRSAQNRSNPSWQITAWVLNNTGGDRERGDCAAWEEPKFSPDDDEDTGPIDTPILMAVEPDTAKHSNNVLVFLEKVAEDEIGRAVIEGLVWAKVDEGTTEGNGVRLIDEEFALKRSWVGTAGTLRGNPSGGGTSGVGWGLIALGEVPQTWILQTNATITARSGTTLGKGNCRAYKMTTAGTLVLTNEIVEAYNSQTETIPTGKIVQATNFQGLPLINVAPCD